MVFREKKTIIFIIVVLTVFLVSVLTRVSSQASKNIVYTLPASFGNWQSNELSYNRELLTSWLGTEHIVFRQYRNTETDASIALYLAYYHDLESSDMAHAPEVCYPGQGWKILSNNEIQFTISPGTQIRAKRMMIEKNAEREIVYSWWQTDGAIIADNSWYHLSQIIKRIAFKDTSSVWVRISAQEAGGEEKNNFAENVIREFCEEAVPLFNNYFNQGSL